MTQSLPIAPIPEQAPIGFTVMPEWLDMVYISTRCAAMLTPLMIGKKGQTCLIPFTAIASLVSALPLSVVLTLCPATVSGFTLPLML